jgi:short-subunit dehydrogenase
MELKKSQIMITGANRGIGKAFAKVCAEDGAHLHLVMRKKEQDLVRELEAAGAASVTLWQADLANRTSLYKLIAGIEALKLDVLFNNAGVAAVEFFDKQTTEEIDELCQTNLTSVMQLTRAVLPGMLKRKHGKIINNSSILAVMHLPCSAIYSATKAAVSSFTTCLKNELHGTGVTTLLLVTPAVKTRLHEGMEKNYKKTFELPTTPLNVQTYAKMIREAVLHDLPIVEPQGLSGLSMRVAKYVPKVFDWEVRRRFTGR